MDAYDKWRFNTRLSQIKAMHELMKCADDEEIYMAWITTGCPDEPSEDDFISIAENDEEFKYSFKLFLKLIKDKEYSIP